MFAIRRLTQEGIAHFREWLEKGAPAPAPFRLLTAPATSEPVQGAHSIEPRNFASRLELGKYLVEVLRDVPNAQVRFDAGLWDWLSLIYIDVLAPFGPDGKRNMKQIYRYTLELRNRLWSRHILRMSWMTVVDHG